MGHHTRIFRGLLGADSGGLQLPIGWRALGLLRIVTALIFFAHGTMKFFGWPAPSTELAEMLQPGTLMWWSGVIEAAFGPFLLLGLFTRPVAFLASGEMAIGYFVIHAPDSFWPAINEGDAAILYTFVFLLLAAAGPGAWSLDGRLRFPPAPTAKPSSTAELAATLGRKLPLAERWKRRLTRHRYGRS